MNKKSIKVKYKLDSKLDIILDDIDNNLEDHIYDITHEVTKVGNKFLDEHHVTKKELRLINKMITVLKFGYENGHVIIADDFYDEILNKYKNYEDEPVVGDIVGRIELDTEHEYPNLRGTLHKANFIWNKDIPKDNKSLKSLEYYFRRWLKVAKGPLSIILSYKYDGCSVIVSISDKGKIKACITRGDESSGANLISLFKDIKFKKHKSRVMKDIGLKTEVVMTKENYEKYITEKGYVYANLRSAVVSILTSLEGEQYSKYLTLVPLYAETKDGKTMDVNTMNAIYSTDVPFISTRIDDLDSIETSMDVISKVIGAIMHNRETLNFAIDGVVIDVVNPEVREAMGRKNSINEYQVAYKFPALKEITYVRDVDFTVGRTGQVTPMVIYDEIDFNGSKHFQSSLSSYDRFKNMDLKPGDKIEVTYNNDVMPYVWKDLYDIDNISNTNKPFEYPDKCVCGGELTLNGSNYFCYNNDCIMKCIGGLTWFCQVMGIKNFSEKTISLLILHGKIKNVYDLINLKEKDLKGLPGFAEKKIKSLSKQLEELRTKEIPQHILCTALGISGIKTCEEIVSNIGLKMIVENPKSLFELSFEGISDKKKKKFLLNLKYYVDTGILEKLFKTMNISKKNKVDVKYKVCFTGFRNKQFKEYLESQGIQVVESLKDIKYLVVATKGHTSSKVDKAIKNGVTIISVDEFMEEVGF